jgi:glycosyltransferase involved in cell wall biosynthesis
MSPPPIVWFVAHEANLSYGANLSLINLIDGLRALGFAPRVILPERGSMVEALAAREITPEIAEYYPWCTYGRPWKRVLWCSGRNWKAARALARPMAARDRGVVYSNSGVIPVGALLANRLGWPHLWHLREYGDLDHGLVAHWGYPVHRWFFRRATTVISNSRAVRDHHVPSMAPARSPVIYNGVAWERDLVRLREQRSRPSGTGRPFTFVLVGRMVPSKGQDTAIRALARVREAGPSVRLLLVGDGPAEFVGECRNLVATLGLEAAVDFLGYRRDVSEILVGSDAALICSHREAMGRVTAEAMAAGVPVVGHGTGGTTELIQHGETGLLFEGGDEALAAQMLSLVRREGFAARLGAAAQEYARRQFTIEAYASAVAKVIVAAAGTG